MVAHDPIVSFYSGGTDTRGRTLGQVLAWSDRELEAVHDFIQWMFPTIQPSGVNPDAPLITRDTIDAFSRRPELRDALRRSLCGPTRAAPKFAAAASVVGGGTTMDR